MLLIFNTIELTGLGIDADIMAANTWKTYIILYDKKSLIGYLDTETELRNISLVTNGDFPTYINLLRKKVIHTRALEANISDKNFVTIILNSFPSTWDSIVITVFKSSLSSNIIAKLHTWWLRVYQNYNQNSPKGIITLHTSNSQYCNQSQLLCTNLKCN